MREQYTTTQIFFLQQNVKGVTARELTEMFNACFETNKSVDAIRQYLRATGLSKFLLRTPRYTDEQLTFIYANKDLTIAELTERFNKRFGTRKMPKHIKYAKKARGWLREPNNRRPNQAQRIRVNKKTSGWMCTFTSVCMASCQQDIPLFIWTMISVITASKICVQHHRGYAMLFQCRVMQKCRRCLHRRCMHR